MKRNSITIGEFPEGALVRVAHSAVIATVSDDKIRYWIAPEALPAIGDDFIEMRVGQDEENHACMKVKNWKGDSKRLHSFYADEDEVINWHIRLIPVDFGHFTHYSAPMLTYTETMEDEAAAISVRESMQGRVRPDLSDSDLWFGRPTPHNALPMIPTVALQERYRIGNVINAIGVQTMHNTEQLPIQENDNVKLVVGARLRTILGFVVRSFRDKPNFMNVYHAAVTYFALLCKAGIILPRQHDPEMFDALCMATEQMTDDWHIELDDLARVLGLLPLKDPNAQWEKKDIIHNFGEKDSQAIAEGQGLDEKYWDANFEAVIVDMTNKPDADVFFMGTNELVDVLQVYGVEIDVEDLGLKDERLYTFSVIIKFTNNAFRDFFVDSGRGHLFLDEDDEPENNEDGPVEA